MTIQPPKKWVADVDGMRDAYGYGVPIHWLVLEDPLARREATKQKGKKRRHVSDMMNAEIIKATPHQS